MSRTQKWISVLCVLVIIGVATLYWLNSVSQCKFGESQPAYSPDRRFYTQVQGIVCRDEEKTHYSLLLGRFGKREKEVILELNSSPTTMHYAWINGDELDIQVPRKSILKEHGPFDASPRVVVTTQ